MFNPSTNPLPATVIAAINPCNILHSFSKFDRLTVFLNNLFNTYDVYTFDKEYFFLFLKEMIKKKHIKRHELSFFKHHKEDKVIKLAHERFPHLKRMEVLTLIDLVKEDEEVYPHFAETIGLEVPKKKKITKKQKLELGKTNPSPAKAKPKKVAKVKSAKTKTKTKVQPASFGAWKDGFGNKEN